MPPYAKITDNGAPAGWPDRAKLCEIMQEQEEELILALSGGGGITRLAEMLGSHPSSGLSGGDYDLRIQVYGGNYFAEKKLKSYLELVWDGLHDMIILLLLVMSAVSFGAEMIFGDHPETGWIESVAICISVAIIVNVAASTDYFKERMFQTLSKQLEGSNKKVVVRCGVQVEVQDKDIVVGDVLTFNSHNLASIPCDGLLLSVRRWP